jgi:hypothetical protein
MKAEELRIGNWVNRVYMPYGNTNQGVEPVRVGITELQHALGLLGVCSFDVDPIPLTPEILEKAGFVNDYNGYDHPSKVSLSITKDGDYMACWQDRAIRPIQSVHQLQNLYFALTGQELGINL